MMTIIPDISISIDQIFTPHGEPDALRYSVSAIVDTDDEISHLGRIQFENPESLVALYNALGAYLRMHHFTNLIPDYAPEKGGSDE